MPTRKAGLSIDTEATLALPDAANPPITHSGASVIRKQNIQCLIHPSATTCSLTEDVEKLKYENRCAHKYEGTVMESTKTVH